MSLEDIMKRFELSRDYVMGLLLTLKQYGIASQDQVEEASRLFEYKSDRDAHLTVCEDDSWLLTVSVGEDFEQIICTNMGMDRDVIPVTLEVIHTWLIDRIL
jgi:hypothetical protein